MTDARTEAPAGSPWSSGPGPRSGTPNGGFRGPSWAGSRLGDRDGLEIHPNLWAGIGLVRGGAGTALVGSHDEVAGRSKEYHALGIDEFVLSGYPHLEEAYWFGEGVLPRLAAQGLWRHPFAGPAVTAAQVPFASRGA